MFNRFSLLFLTLITFADGEQFIPSSFVHQPFAFDAEGIVADFDTKVRDGELDAAVKMIQEGIDKSQGLVINSKTFDFISARVFFTEKLLKADAKTLKAYRMLADPRAEELFNKAIISNDKPEFKKILDTYGATSFAERARQYLADYCLAEGDFEAALSYLKDLKTVTAQKLYKTAFCLEKLEREKEAVKAYNDLGKLFGFYEIEQGGTKVKAGTLALTKSTSLTNIPKLQEPLFKSGEMAMKWEALSLPENSFEVSEPVISAGKVLIVQDRVFTALDLDWGLVSFKTTPFEAKNLVETGAFPALCGPGIAADGSFAAVRYFLTKIACAVYDTEKNETQLYLTPEQLGAGKGKYSRSLNLPAVKDNAVYLGLLQSKDNLSQYYMVKMGRNIGDIKWSVSLGSGNQSEFMFENAPAPVFSGEDIIVETNLFTLACLDRDLGTLKWTLGIPPETELGVDERLAENNPPYKNLLVDGNLIFYAPKHKKVIITIDKYTGRKLWELSRNNSEYLVGEKDEYFYTCDSVSINRINKITGRRLSLFRPIDNGCIGRVAYFNGYFYYPIYKGVGIVDINGQNFKKYPLSHQAKRLFPFDGGLLIYGDGTVHLYQDKTEVVTRANQIKENTPEYIPAGYCLAVLACFEGKTEEGKKALNNLLMLENDALGKEDVKAKLESLVFEEARTAFLGGNYALCRELLGKLQGTAVYRSQTSWLLLQSYIKQGEKANMVGIYEKIIKEDQGKFFEPEPGLEIRADYYAGVRLKGLTEHFPLEAEKGRSYFDLSSKPLWETKGIASAASVRPFLSGSSLFFAHPGGFSALDLDSGKLTAGTIKAKKKNVEVNYGRYGFYPDSSAGDSGMICFCMPNNSIYGIDPKTRVLNFEWHPEKKKSQSFLPNSLALTENLVILHDPFGGILALERKTALNAYEISGEFSEPCFYKDMIFAVEKRTMLLRGYEAATGIKKWELNLQVGMQNLEIKCDASYLYIIIEEGIIYKVKQATGYLLLSKKIRSDKGGWDFFPAEISEDAIFISTGRNIYCVEKGLLTVRWMRDTFSCYRNETKPGPKKGQVEIGKPVLVEKPAERQKDVSWLYLLDSKLLARTGEFIEVYDALTGKPELWLEKALPLTSKNKFSPVNCYYYSGNLIVVNGGTAACFKGSQPAAVEPAGKGKKNK